MASGIGKALRAAIGNAIVWGAGWTGLAIVTLVGLRAVGLVVPPTLQWYDYLGMAVRVGFVGAIAGAAFSAVLRLTHRGRRLSELSATRFGVVGGIGTGLFVPTFMQLASLLGGDGFVPWEHIRDDIVIVTLFGGVAAGVSVKLAQLASRFVPDDPPMEIDDGAVIDRLAAGIDTDRFARWGRPINEDAPSTIDRGTPPPR